MKVKFIKKGTPYGFAYGAGEVGFIGSPLQAKELEKEGVIQILPEPQKPKK